MVCQQEESVDGTSSGQELQGVSTNRVLYPRPQPLSPCWLEERRGRAVEKTQLRKMVTNSTEASEISQQILKTKGTRIREWIKGDGLTNLGPVKSVKVVCMLGFKCKSVVGASK